jgi:hypothetical protein
VIRFVFKNEIQRQVNDHVRLAVRAIDDTNDRLISQDTYPRDRHDYDRNEVLRDALDAWRHNPLARRIVELTSQYVVGGGLGVEAKNERTHRFLKNWWEHRLNRMSMRSFDLCDELTRTGNIFLIISTDPGGMSYLRALPTADVLEIETAPNDVEQKIRIWERSRMDGTEVAGPNGILGHPWPVYDEDQDSASFPPVILHYSVNRPVGAKWGESDLAPLLRWLSRYSVWLEDRARLNRYRQSFMYVVKAMFTSQAERLARQSELNANPPNPGSILVADQSEEWSVLNPTLSSFEASEDGLSLKKMIAVGSGTPLHFLAEPESATRTTAEAAGGPTYRHYEQRQLFFKWMIGDIVKVILNRRALVDRNIRPNTEITVKGSDISARDNAALATAATTIIAAFASLRDRGLIDDAELLRMAYRFAGEVVDVEGMLRRGAAAPPPAITRVDIPSSDDSTGSGVSKPSTPGNGKSPSIPGVKINPIKVNPTTGEPTNAE